MQLSEGFHNPISIQLKLAPFLTVGIITFDDFFSIFIVSKVEILPQIPYFNSLLKLLFLPIRTVSGEIYLRPYSYFSVCILCITVVTREGREILFLAMF